MSARTLRRANVVGMARSKNPDLNPGAVCRYCGKTDWIFYATYQTPFTASNVKAVTNALPMRLQTSNEVRCVCGRKACLDNMNYLKTLAVFGEIKEREFDKL